MTLGLVHQSTWTCQPQVYGFEVCCFEIYGTDDDNKQKEDSLTEKSISRIIIFSCFPVLKDTHHEGNYGTKKSILNLESEVLNLKPSLFVY